MDMDVEEEGEDGGGNLDSFNLSLGHQTKLVVHMNNPNRISSANLGVAPPIHSGIRGAKYSPSPTDACLPGPLLEQVLVPRELPPSQEDHTFLEEEWVANHPYPR